MVERNHHADHWPALLVLMVIPKALVLNEPLPGRDLRLAVPARRRQRPKAPQVVDARHGADEVRVRHVREGRQVRLVPAGRADAAPRPDPLPRALRVRLRALAVQDLDPPRLEGAGAVAARPVGVRVRRPAVFDRRDDAGRDRHVVVHRLLAAAAFAHE